MKSGTLVRLVVSLFVLALPGPGRCDTTTSMGDHSGEGSTPFTGLTQSPEANLFTGAATTHIPIALPPGRKNMTPSLAMQYTSAGGPSPFGYGWDIPIARIERSTKWGTPGCGGTHTNDFVLTLPSGSIELVNDPPNSDTYLPRYQEGYVKAQKFIGDNHWEVTDRSGIKYIFGGSATARVATDASQFLSQDANGFCRFTAVWMLTHMEDPNGNSIDVTWFNVSGVPYPWAVNYGGNSAQALPHFYHVLFGWQIRTDFLPSSHYGVTQELLFRLASLAITTDHPPAGSSSAVRTYSLAYDEGTATEPVRSHLTRVTVTGDDWPQQFAYSTSLTGHGRIAADGTLQLGASDPLTAPSGTYLRKTTSTGSVTSTVMDMTGDAIPDLIKEVTSPTDPHFDVYVGGPGGFATNAIRWNPPTFTHNWPIRATTPSGCQANGHSFHSCVYQDIFDITGDGIPDYVDAGAGPTEWTVYPGRLNQNTASGFFDQISIHWPAPYSFINADRSDGQGDPTLRTVQDVTDINGDGLPDLIYVPNGQTQAPYGWEVYLNTGVGFESAALPYFSAPTAGIQWVQHSDDRSTGSVWQQLMDFNGDGLLDLLIAGSAWEDRCAFPDGRQAACLDVYLNNGQGFSNTPRTSSLDGGSGIRGWQQNDTFSDIFDINGDGLPDHIVLTGNSNPQTWDVQLNLGGQLDDSNTPWPGLSGPIRRMQDPYTKIDMLDLDGDGLLDRVAVDATGWHIQRNLNPVRPNLLTVVRSALGGLTTLRYQPSTIYDNTGGDSGMAGDGIVDLPFVTWVVDGIRETDGLCSPGAVGDPFSAANPCIASGNEVVSEFVYQGGRFDPDERDFRGFRQVYRIDRNDPEPSNATSTIFAQTAPIKGRILHVARYAGDPITDNSPRLVAEEDNTWSTQPIGSNGRLQVWLSINTKARHDLQPSTSQKLTTSNLSPDPHGNISDVSTYGADTSVDLVHVHTDFALPDGSAAAIYDRPSHVWSEYSSANGLTKSAEKWFYYDGGTEGMAIGQVAKGNLRKVESLVDILAGTKVSVHSAYDGYGNVTGVTDERGTPHSTTFDAFGHLYPAVETNALWQTITTVTDYRWGKPISVTDDGNNAQTTYAYDNAGRVRCVAKPGDSVASCTDTGSTAASQRYTYHEASGAVGDTYSWVQVEKREPNRSGGYLPTTQYFDALGRVRYAVTPKIVNCGTVETNVVRGDTVYDAGGRVARRYDPYSAPFQTRNGGVTVFDYHLNGDSFIDPLGRPYKTIVPNDGSSGAGRTVQTTYDQGTTTSYDPAGNKAVRLVDTYGRTTHTEVYNGSVKYSWMDTAYDGAGRVLTTEQKNNPHTIVTTTYDLLGRKTQVDDPDSGTWTYAYDASGNLVFENDPETGQHIEYCFDVLNRPTTKAYFTDDTQHGTCSGDVHISGMITYTYDQTTYGPGTSPPSNKGVGRLTRVDDLSGSVLYRYDERGRTTDTQRTIHPPSEAETSASLAFVYDAADRVVQTYYPDAEVAQTTYDATAQPKKLVATNGTVTASIVDPVCMDLLGRATGITHGNGVTDTLQYYGLPGSGAFAKGHAPQRIITHLTGLTDNYLDLEYRDYDSRGLLTTLTDHRDATAPLSNTATYNYDFAGRLTGVSGPRMTNGYGYDALDNITSKGGSTFAYPTNKPHQPTSYASQTLSHDANGNRTGKGTHTYEYDADDHLWRIDSGQVEFSYDYSGRRVAKIAGGEVTRYYFPLVEASSQDTGTLTKYYVLGSMVVASRTDQNTLFAAVSDPAVQLAERSMLQPAVVLVLRRDVRIAVAASLALCGMVLLLAPWRRRRVVGIAVRPGHAVGAALAVGLATLPWPILLFPAPAWGDCGTAPPPYFHYHHDHLGSVQAVSDPTGAVVEYVRYSPWGEVNRYSISGASVSPDERWRREFTGYETEPISGLAYAGARFYDPELALFNTHDPARQFASPYTYTDWNPINRTDPDGAFLPELLVFLATVGPLLAGIASAIDTGIRTGDPSAALGAFGASYTIGGAVGGLSMIVLGPASLSAKSLYYTLAAAGLGYSTYGSVGAAEHGYYASAVVGLGLTAVAAAGLVSSAAQDWGTGNLRQARAPSSGDAGAHQLERNAKLLPVRENPELNAAVRTALGNEDVLSSVQEAYNGSMGGDSRDLHEFGFQAQRTDLGSVQTLIGVGDQALSPKFLPFPEGTTTLLSGHMHPNVGLAPDGGEWALGPNISDLRVFTENPAAALNPNVVINRQYIYAINNNSGTASIVGNTQSLLNLH